jgi:superfamily II DNA/RNA helicase
VENFSQLYLRSDVVNALENIGVTQPTVIQMLAIPKIAAGKNVLCASETGTGRA